MNYKEEEKKLIRECDKCHKEVDLLKLEKVEISGIPKLLCQECLTKLKRHWMDWYSGKR